MNPPIIRGRGTPQNPANRFHRLHIAHDDDPEIAPQTQLFQDTSKTILSENDSPDLRFRFSVNPYRGCEHGCAYCFARPSHEYLGFSAGLDFESRIMVKPDAPGLLRAALMRPKYEPDRLAMSGVTDCYQPVERSMKITRGCLEVLTECHHPVVL